MNKEPFQKTQNNNILNPSLALGVTATQDRDLPNAVKKDELKGQSQGANGMMSMKSKAAVVPNSKKRNFKQFGNATQLQDEDSDLVQYNNLDVSKKQSEHDKANAFQKMEMPLKQRKLDKKSSSKTSVRETGFFKNQQQRKPFQPSNSNINIAANPQNQISKNAHRSLQKFPSFIKTQNENIFLGAGVAQKHVSKQMKGQTNHFEESPSQSQFKDRRGLDNDKGHDEAQEKPSMREGVFKLPRISEVSHLARCDDSQSKKTEEKMDKSSPLQTELNLFKCKDGKRSISAISVHRNSGFGPLFEPQMCHGESVYREETVKLSNDILTQNHSLQIQKRNQTPVKLSKLFDDSSPTCKLSVQRDLGDYTNFEFEACLADASLDLNANEFSLMDLKDEQAKQQINEDFKKSELKLPFLSDLSPITKDQTQKQDKLISNERQSPSDRESLMSQINHINFEINFIGSTSNQIANVQVLERRNSTNSMQSRKQRSPSPFFQRQFLSNQKSSSSRDEPNLEIDIDNQELGNRQHATTLETIPSPVLEESYSTNGLNEGFLLGSQESLQLSSINMSQNPLNSDNQVLPMQTTASTVIQTSMRNLSLNINELILQQEEDLQNVQLDQIAAVQSQEIVSPAIFSITEFMNQQE